MNNIVRGVDTYWLSQPLRTQFNQSHSLNVSGGSNEFRFNFGLRYQNENGVMKDSYRDIYTADMTLEYRLQTFSIQNKVTMNIMERANSPYGSFSTYTQLLPYDSPYDLNTGELIPKLKGWGGSGRSDYTNPLYDVHRTNNSDEGNYTQFVNNLQVSYSPTQSPMAKLKIFEYIPQGSTASISFDGVGDSCAVHFNGTLRLIAHAGKTYTFTPTGEMKGLEGSEPVHFEATPTGITITLNPNE